MAKYSLTLFISIIFIFSSVAQKKVAITIDDVPNIKLYQADKSKSLLLQKIDSMSIPVTIFINEGMLYKSDSIGNNISLLQDWVMSKNVELGNHTFAHLRYSKEGIEKFSDDIKRGEEVTRELAHKYEKDLKYFRAPYNDLGSDSIQHAQLDSVLQTLGYTNTPFTVESSDWMFNSVYTSLLHKKDYAGAREVGELYVAKTLAYFHFFDSLANLAYGREIDHIYLCHDNQLNTDYLTSIISQLQNKAYEIASLEEVLRDEFYVQEDTYFFKWGVSWYYRFMDSQENRYRAMRAEPDLEEINQLFEGLK